MHGVRFLGLKPPLQLHFHHVAHISSALLCKQTSSQTNSAAIPCLSGRNSCGTITIYTPHCFVLAHAVMYGAVCVSHALDDRHLLTI
jgi:hypothetical protein